MTEEELRQEIADRIEITMLEPWWRTRYTERLADQILPLFAARVAAIEQERDTLSAAAGMYSEALVFAKERAEKAETERDRYRLEAELNGREVYGMYQHWRERGLKAEAELAAIEADLDEALETKERYALYNNEFVAARAELVDRAEKAEAELAALTAERDAAREALRLAADRSILFAAAEQRVAAERTQAAAQALTAAADAIGAANGRTERGFDIAHAASWLRHMARIAAGADPMSVDAHPPAETFTRKDMARAWDEGWKASVRSPHTAPYSDDNPYRGTP